MTIWPALLLLTFGLIEPVAQQASASDPWFQRSAKRGDFRPALLPWKTFNVDLPKDWDLVRGFGTTLLTATDKPRNNQPTGAIVIEHTALAAPLGPADVNAFLAGLELKLAMQRDPSGRNFEQEAKEVDKQRFVFIQYARDGFGPERVAVYSFPTGNVIYRLICIAPEMQMHENTREIFAHVASSFRAAASAK